MKCSPEIQPSVWSRQVCPLATANSGKSVPLRMVLLNNIILNILYNIIIYNIFNDVTLWMLGFLVFDYDLAEGKTASYLADTFVQSKSLKVIHTYIHRQMVVAAMQGANQHIRSSLGFSMLHKDTLACRPGESNQQPSSNKSHSHLTPWPWISVVFFVFSLGISVW